MTDFVLLLILFPQYHSDAEAASYGASWSRSTEDQELSKQHWRETQPDKVYGPTRTWHTTETCEHESNHTVQDQLNDVMPLCPIWKYMLQECG